MHIKAIYLYKDETKVRVTVDNQGEQEKIYIEPSGRYNGFVMEGAEEDVLNYVIDIAYWLLTTDYFNGDMSKRNEANLVAKRKYKTRYYESVI